ncbi:MAG: hypothetical protein ABR956_05425 [Terracidiphilus sp.]|jgi:hypothetical protein
MRVRLLVMTVCQTIAGILSFAVSFYGVYSFMSVDLRQDTGVSVLFCLLPVLSFPVFLLPFRRLRLSVALLWILAVAYLAVYSRLDWRTCAELGYCQSMPKTVLRTLTAWPVEGLFGAAVLDLAVLFLKRGEHSPARSRDESSGASA